MKKVAQGGVGLTAQDKADLKAFFIPFRPFEFINNPAFNKSIRKTYKTIC